MPARFCLHGLHASGPTYKVGLMLSLCGEPFDYVHVNISGGEHKQPAYLARHATARFRFSSTPATAAISASPPRSSNISPIHRKIRRRRPRGADPGARMDVLGLRPARHCRSTGRARSSLASARRARRSSAHTPPTARPGLLSWIRHLAGRASVVGEGATIADIDLYGVVNFAEEAGFDLTSLANVRAWAERFEDAARASPCPQRSYRAKPRRSMSDGSSSGEAQPRRPRSHRRACTRRTPRRPRRRLDTRDRPPTRRLLRRSPQAATSSSMSPKRTVAVVGTFQLTFIPNADGPRAACAQLESVQVARTCARGGSARA